MEKRYVSFGVYRRKRRRGYDRFRVRTASPLSYLRLRRSTYSDAASADTAAIAMPLNSGTGMLDCSRYMFCPVPVWPLDTATDQVCDAMPGLLRW